MVVVVDDAPGLVVVVVVRRGVVVVDTGCDVVEPGVDVVVLDEVVVVSSSPGSTSGAWAPAVVADSTAIATTAATAIVVFRTCNPFPLCAAG